MRIAELPGRRARENERGSSAVAVLALELDEAADRQPVQRVQRLAAPSRRTFGRGRRERRCRTRGRRHARDRAVSAIAAKWPSSWISTSTPRMRTNSRIVIADWTSADHADAPPTGPVAKAARTSASSATSSSTSGAGPRPSPKRSTAASSSARDAREVQRAVEESRHRHLVGGDQRGRRATPDPAGLAGDAQRREPRLVGRAEVEPRRPRADPGGRRRREAVGIASGRTGWGVACPGCRAGP